MLDDFRVADLNAALEDGLGISGPAARRAITAAATAPQYTGTVITARQARQILANPQLAVYDNPHTLLMCVYKRDKALCHPRPQGHPQPRRVRTRLREHRPHRSARRRPPSPRHRA